MSSPIDDRRTVSTTPVVRDVPPLSQTNPKIKPDPDPDADVSQSTPPPPVP
eukprot:CAMPEP_0194437246 /NCGR_PEP_ID=MMETSP0176-20130528/99071_1 /TAXON_ID=216777 /ORGANISM="Proboscia alata, Strain PI-D3" /LENGTH=50 /DNA_ID=CAMNT_0039258351 /DNA_START=74 /DNA_END=222 /DNA_ORIENTATION=+